MRKRLFGLLLAAIFILGLSSCTNPPPSPDDVLTQKVIPEGKTPLTILVKSAFSINGFEKTAEAEFPEIDIVQVGNYSASMGLAEYEKRLQHDDLTDIVMMWPLQVGEEYWDDRLIDLSTLPLSGSYVTSMLDNISRDGKLYYLPGPSQVRGILYNKTLFSENGWEVPSTFPEFLTLCQDIEKTGIRALQLGLENPEVLDTAFTGFGYDGSYSTPENNQRIADFNSGKDSFAHNFTPALHTFQTLIDAGVLKKEDLGVNYADREQLLFTRKCAMIEDSVLLARMGKDYNGCTDEFALMPFINPEDGGDWARLYPVCYVGMNKHLEEPENKEKYDLALKLLAYISTPKGQEALASDTGAMFSSLKGVPPPNVPEIENLLPALNDGRYAVFPTLKNAQTALRDGLKGMVEGTLTASDVVKLVDAENQNPPTPTPPPVLGHAAEDFTLTDTGSFLTDAMCAQSGCEIGLFLDNGKDGRYNGKGINGKIYQGDLVPEDLTRILPDLRYDETGTLWKITMSGADLEKTLEYSIPIDNNKEGWFYYFSGLKMDYAPAAVPGNRIHKITDDAGHSLDPKRLYSIAVMDNTVPPEYIVTCEKTDLPIRTIFENALKASPTVSPAKDHRFTLCQP